MPTLQNNTIELIELMDDSTTEFIEGVAKTQTAMYNKLIHTAGGLMLDPSGNIKPTIANMRILARIERQIEAEIITDAYKKRVSKLIKRFPEIKDVNDLYFVTLSKKFVPGSDMYKKHIETAMKLTQTSLMEAGINENIINPIINIIDDSIVNGASWQEMVKTLNTKILGSPDTMGGLERYSKQIVTDGMNQYNASYNRLVAEKLDIEWYRYAGGLRKSSRPFCRGHANKYYHKKEVEDFGKGKDVDGTRLTKSEKEGRVKGTNASNIFKYRGGYNCRHLYRAINISRVPKKVIDRNIKKGYYKVPNMGNIPNLGK